MTTLEYWQFMVRTKPLRSRLRAAGKPVPAWLTPEKPAR